MNASETSLAVVAQTYRFFCICFICYKPEILEQTLEIRISLFFLLAMFWRAGVNSNATTEMSHRAL